METRNSGDEEREIAFFETIAALLDAIHQVI